jgi:hypothetical protein
MGPSRCNDFGSIRERKFLKPGGLRAVRVRGLLPWHPGDKALPAQGIAPLKKRSGIAGVRGQMVVSLPFVMGWGNGHSLHLRGKPWPGCAGQTGQSGGVIWQRSRQGSARAAGRSPRPWCPAPGGCGPALRDDQGPARPSFAAKTGMAASLISEMRNTADQTWSTGTARSSGGSQRPAAAATPRLCTGTVGRAPRAGRPDRKTLCPHQESRRESAV